MTSRHSRSKTWQNMLSLFFTLKDSPSLPPMQAKLLCILRNPSQTLISLIAEPWLKIGEKKTTTKLHHVKRTAGAPLRKACPGESMLRGMNDGNKTIQLHEQPWENIKEMGQKRLAETMTTTYQNALPRHFPQVCCIAGNFPTNLSQKRALCHFWVCPKCGWHACSHKIFWTDNLLFDQRGASKTPLGFGAKT